VLTGESYPARMLAYRFTLIDGSTIDGTAQQPIYVRDGEQVHRLILHERQKGPIGATLESLLYVRSVRLGEEALKSGRSMVAAATTQPAASQPASRPDQPPASSLSPRHSRGIPFGAVAEESPRNAGGLKNPASGPPGESDSHGPAGGI